MKTLKVMDLGKKDYSSTYRLQLELVEKRIKNEIEDVLIFVEHDPPVITLGRSAKREHLLVLPDELERLGIEIAEIDRGGDITYHGPGQLVCYPIFDLKQHVKDLHLVLRLYEEIMLKTIESYGLAGQSIEGYTGAWVGKKKIGAIGIAVRQWVTYHGLAFNVNPELGHFSLIVPCGIRDYGVTSLQCLLDYPVDFSGVKERILREFARIFQFAALSKEGY